MNPPEPTAELRELCDRLLDGDFTAADRARLETLVRGDARLCELYVALMHEHTALREHAGQLREEAPGGELPSTTMPPQVRVGAAGFFRRWLPVAAALVVGAGGWWLVAHRGARPVATLVEAASARWSSSSLPTAPGSALGVGRLRLEEGMARIVFRSGAEVRLEGPAEFELLERNGCFLHAGVLTAHVPVPARGFSVGTNVVQVVDHGTDFGLSARPGGLVEVRVLNGEVELRHVLTGQSRRLRVREAARITVEQFWQLHANEGEAVEYPTRHEPAVMIENTLILSSAAGRGDAAYVASPESTLNRSDTLLLLKNHSADAKHQRKAYVRFDLAPLAGRRVEKAVLTLNFEATGLGYASLTEACTFAVYGVTDDTQDGWSSTTLAWENAPAFSPDPGAADPARAVRLGTFELPRGVVSGAFGISGDALVRFLNADANRQATLIVVRETVLDREKAVHGFAGNRHPTLAPPTLQVTLAAVP